MFACLSTFFVCHWLLHNTLIDIVRGLLFTPPFSHPPLFARRGSCLFACVPIRLCFAFVGCNSSSVYSTPFAGSRCLGRPSFYPLHELPRRSTYDVLRWWWCDQASRLPQQTKSTKGHQKEKEIKNKHNTEYVWDLVCALSYPLDAV